MKRGNREKEKQKQKQKQKEKEKFPFSADATQTTLTNGPQGHRMEPEKKNFSVVALKLEQKNHLMHMQTSCVTYTQRVL